MALTVNIDRHSIHGNTRVVYFRIGFDSTYPVGGEALAGTDIGLRVIDDIAFTGSGRFGYTYYTDTVLPASTLNVEILCPTGGTAPTTIANPVPTIGTLDATVDAGAVAVTSSAANGAVATVVGAPGLTGGRGVELGAADASSLINIRCVAHGV